MLLYIVRHGDPDYKNDCLTALGKRQAEAVGRRLALHGLDRVFSSPMGRARETAAPVCEMLKLDCPIEEWVSEDRAYREMSVDNGRGGSNWIFRVKPPHEYKDEENLRLGIDGWTKSPLMNGRDMEAAYLRICDGSDDLLRRLGYAREGTAQYRCERHNSERVAVFCHEGAGMTWISHLLGIPPHIMWASFEITHASVSLFEFGEEPGLTVPRCLCMGDCSHILAERLPYRHANRLEM